MMRAEGGHVSKVDPPQRFVLSAAHCFCSDQVKGVKCVANDQVRKEISQQSMSDYQR